MSLCENPELLRILDHVTRGMEEYTADGTANYSEEDIAKCRTILLSHVSGLEKVKDRAAALELVRSTVIRLNNVNAEAGEDLIETDQREEICEFIIKAGALMGFNSEDEDVTEQWREW